MHEVKAMEPSEKFYLHPGNIFASEEPHIVTTILGSCVGVCLWDPVHKRGGINHYLLPLWNGDGLPIPKFGNIAIKRLIEKMEEMGSGKRLLKAKLFGGSAINTNEGPGSGLLNVGKRNIEIARDVLGDEGIPIVGEDTGGPLGRRLLFNTESGKVRMKLIQKTIASQRLSIPRS